MARAPWDLVLLADVLYETCNVAPLLDLLPRLTGEVLLADPGRATATPFLEGVIAGWHVTTTRDARVRVHRLQAR